MYKGNGTFTVNAKAERNGEAKEGNEPKSDDFKSVAKRLECDEDKKRFEEWLGKIARAKPEKKRRANEKIICPFYAAPLVIVFRCRTRDHAVC